MTEVFSNSSSRGYISAKKLREMKKKALQSYKKISTIKANSDKEQAIASAKADQALRTFIKDA